jgi:outer membrane protein X
MKKLIFILILAFLASGARAQIRTESAHLKLGYATERKQFGVGAQVRLGLTDALRIAPDAILFLPKNHTVGLDFNANLEYDIRLQSNVGLYPLIGLSMANTRFSYRGDSYGNTDFGINLGAGVDYDISKSNYLNVEFRYTFNDWDYASLFVGYGFKF